MKYLIGTALFFVAFLVFAPTHYSNGIRNLPLLIAILSVIAAYLIFRAARRINLLYKIRKKLKEEKYRIRRFRIIPNLLGIKGKYDIVAEGHHSTLNIVVLMRRRTGIRYHFERPDLLELYTGSRHSMRATRHGMAKVSIAQTRSFDSTELKGRQRLPFPAEAAKDEVNIVIMDRFPRAITDSVSRHELGSGDPVCGSLRIFEMK